MRICECLKSPLTKPIFYPFVLWGHLNFSQEEYKFSEHDSATDEDHRSKSNPLEEEPKPNEQNSDGKRKRYACDQCGQSYTRPCSLRTHKMSAHLGIRPYVCDICAKCYGTYSHIKMHMLTHCQTKPFACEQCDKSFSEKSSLKRHTRSAHQAIRPYTCDICGRHFAWYAELKKHLFTHNAAKTHACDICKRAFSTKFDMNVHKRTVHDGVRSHVCDECGKVSFSISIALFGSAFCYEYIFCRHLPKCRI